jgi:hypothetical protein
VKIIAAALWETPTAYEGGTLLVGGGNHLFLAHKPGKTVQDGEECGSRTQQLFLKNYGNQTQLQINGNMPNQLSHSALLYDHLHVIILIFSSNSMILFT